MRAHRVLAFAAVGWLACFSGAGGAGGAGDKKADGPPVIQELSAKGLRSKLPRGQVTKPIVIDNAKDLAKTFADEADQAAIGKQVNFDKHYVILFSWGGSGQDKLNHEAAEAKVVFNYTPGLTRDLRYHVGLFALQKGTKWSIESKR